MRYKRRKKKRGFVLAALLVGGCILALPDERVQDALGRAQEAVRGLVKELGGTLGPGEGKLSVPHASGEAGLSGTFAPKGKGQSENIIEYEGFTVSYNPDMRIPDWVLYELTAEETDGPYSRKGKDFQQDPDCRFAQADGNDYRGSGWSRGHMAPAADFKWSDTALSQTFYFTNICPQDKDLNNRYWRTLENKVRGWAEQFGEITVVTGPVIGKNVNGTIGENRVVVPDAFFKAILARTDKGWISIAFVMQNNPDQRLLRDCATTVNRVESLTGLDLFSSLDDSIEESVENQLDYKTWKVY